MQVTDGKFRRRRLVSSTSPKVRPTARRLRELLFEFLGGRVEGARFLDLCAGSGAVGIEALSRGAAHATFVDRSGKMCNFIEQNLERCGVPTEQATIVLSDVAEFLRRAARLEEDSWDIAFFDPPYALDYAPVLEAFGTNRLLRRKGGVLVAEHHCENPLPDHVGSLRRWRTVRQGESCLSFYEKKSGVRSQEPEEKA